MERSCFSKGIVEIDQQHNDFRKADGAQRVGGGEFFELVDDFGALAQSGGVEELHLAVAPEEVHPDGVARDARLRPGQQPFLAENAVDQRGFARIGAADDSDPQRLRHIEVAAVLIVVVEVLLLLLVFLGRLGGLYGQRLAQGLIERAHPLPVLGRERHRIAQPQRESLEGARLPRLPFRLVGDEDHRLAGAAHEIGEIFVVRRHADARVDDEENGVGRDDGVLRLGAHAPFQRGARALLQPGRVDDGEAQIGELPLTLATVAGDAGPVVDQRQLLAGEPVEERRLADIGAADDGEGEGHGELYGAF